MENTNSGPGTGKSPQQVAQEILQRSRESQAEKHVRGARTTLFVLAGLFFLYAVLYGGGVIADDIVSLVVYFIFGIIYILLGLWANSSPRPASIAGLVLYLLMIILIAFADPSTLFKGLIIKALVIIYLIRGISEAGKMPKPAVNVDSLDGNLMK